jgi:aspartyl-tRNA synthetase
MTTGVRQSLGDLRRTHTCGALRPEDVGRDVVLFGWVHRVRDLGSLVFFDLRDRYGLTQIVARAGSGGVLEVARRIRPEHVVAVLGRVERRAPETVNPKLATGEIEVAAGEIRVLNEAKTPPFPIADETPVAEETRLRYRYLDLRRPRMQQNLILRHRVAMALRAYFDEQGFVEIETPVLTKSTPEGARDYLVPSRVHPGEFYALPQSPQLFKQILMIAGFDRYFQIVRCFRDEDLRADRQPEFTQVDIEIAFATRELVFEIVEGALARVMRLVGRELERPLPRIGWEEAIARYGSDKPDLRTGLPIVDVSAPFREAPFEAFRRALADGGAVRGIVVPGAAGASRRELDELADEARRLGAAGLAWARRAAGTVQSSILRAAGEPAVTRALDEAGAGEGDLLLLLAGPPAEASRVLGQIRLSIARARGMIAPDRFAFAWVVDFPLFEWNADEQRWDSVQHPFTAPIDGDEPLLESDPGRVRGQIYDLVLNGWEVGGGSIRIHDSALQSRIFRLLGIGDEEARLRFGFFLDALRYGTPPHGGIALGLDRLTALLAGETSIREVIAFPKTAQAVDLMTGAPSPVSPRQLRELHLRIEE